MVNQKVEWSQVFSTDNGYAITGSKAVYKTLLNENKEFESVLSVEFSLVDVFDNTNITVSEINEYLLLSIQCDEFTVHSKNQEKLQENELCEHYDQDSIVYDQVYPDIDFVGY